MRAPDLLDEIIKLRKRIEYLEGVGGADVATTLDPILGHRHRGLSLDGPRLTPDSAWNGDHLIIGSYHLWVDATGDLRIKASAPLSDTDGDVVGAQS